MKILAIIVTYFPDTTLLTDNINAIEDYVDKILVWENTPATEKERYRIPPRDKIKYVGENYNAGIPKALNFAWKYARSESFDFVLTMDQDSVWEDFRAFLDKTIRLNNDHDCIWGPNPNPSHSTDSQNLEEKAYVNTSGTLVSTDILNKIHGWSETFKLDCVDMDFCYKAQQFGIKTYMVKDAFLRHQLGEKKKILSLKTLRRKEITTHSAERTYGIIRNGVIMGQKYKSFPLKNYLKNNICSRLSAIVLYEDDKVKKTYSIFKGLLDGYTFARKMNRKHFAE